MSRSTDARETPSDWEERVDAPKSAKVLKLTRTTACTKTAIEKVYIAKDAVVISVPRRLITHCPLSSAALVSREAAEILETEAESLETQGVLLS